MLMIYNVSSQHYGIDSFQFFVNICFDYCCSEHKIVSNYKKTVGVIFL